MPLLYYNYAYYMNQMSDERLVEKIQEGEILLYEELVRRYQKGLFVFVMRIIHDAHAGNDIVQDTFIKTYRSISRVNTKKRFSTYIFEIAKNTALSEIRRKKKNVSLKEIADVALEESFIEELYRTDLISGVRHAVLTLPAKYRNVITLYYFREMSYEDIGKHLRIPVNTVRTHLKRAKEELRKLIPYET